MKETRQDGRKEKLHYPSALLFFGTVVLGENRQSNLSAESNLSARARINFPLTRAFLAFADVYRFLNAFNLTKTKREQLDASTELPSHEQRSSTSEMIIGLYRSASAQNDGGSLDSK